MKKQLICTIASIGFVLVTAQSQSQIPVYHANVLGIPDGRTAIQVANPTSMNRWGQVIGIYGGGINTHAVLWTPHSANDGFSAGTLFAIESSPGLPIGTAVSFPSGINARGQVVGQSFTPGQGDGNQRQSWMWKPTTLNSPLGILHGTSGSAVTFPQVAIPGFGASSEYNQLINIKGAIAANGINARLLLWTPTTLNGMVGTWTFDPNHGAHLSGFNDLGQIAGNSCESAIWNGPYLHSGVFPPLLDSDVLTSPLWIPPTSIPTCVGGTAGLNAKGHLAVTVASSAGNGILPYLYKNGKAFNISAGLASHAQAINGFDQVVGSATSSHNFAALFQNGKAEDLNTLNDATALGLSLSGTVAINDVGQILATGNATALLTPNALVINPVLVTKGPMLISGTTYSQTITVQNLGATPIIGPVSVALDGLTPGVLLTNKIGTTVYTHPGSVYTNVSTVDLAAGGTTPAFNLIFANPKLKTINYTARVLGTTAPR